jgi:cyanate lyase
MTMTRDDVTEQVIAARIAGGLTWEQLAKSIGRPVVWTTAALLGQHPIPAAEAQTLVGLLELSPDCVALLGTVPMRGGASTAVPTDPTIYRFHEALSVYGPALKELIHEQFGDGIMSAINFSLSLERKSHPDGDRVVVIFDGKFLPYDWTSS